MPASSLPSDMTFETALSELETLVKNLESGKTSLEDSINSYARGMELKNFCEARLREAQLKVEQITQSVSGAIGTTPFDTNS